jgi:hypothetical protein
MDTATDVMRIRRSSRIEQEDQQDWLIEEAPRA